MRPSPTRFDHDFNRDPSAISSEIVIFQKDGNGRVVTIVTILKVTVYDRVNNYLRLCKRI